MECAFENLHLVPVCCSVQDVSRIRTFGRPVEALFLRGYETTSNIGVADCANHRRLVIRLAISRDPIPDLRATLELAPFLTITRIRGPLDQ